MLVTKEIIDRSMQLNIFPAVFALCKIDIFLLPSLLNRVLLVGLVSTGLVGQWDGGLVSKWSVVGWSMVGGFNKTLWYIRKNCNQGHCISVYKDKVLLNKLC